MIKYKLAELALFVSLNDLYMELVKNVARVQPGEHTTLLAATSADATSYVS